MRGYRDALALIHQSANSLAISEPTILRLHALARGEIWDAGKFKEKDGDIIERLVQKMGANGFAISELEQVCPGVSRDMVRTVLREQQKLGQLECKGRGPAAKWCKKPGQ